MDSHRIDNHLMIMSLRDLVQGMFNDERPSGRDFAACRAILQAEPSSEHAFPALCMLLEGLLADADLDLDSTRVVVTSLKALARGEISVGDVL